MDEWQANKAQRHTHNALEQHGSRRLRRRRDAMVSSRHEESLLATKEERWLVAPGGAFKHGRGFIPRQRGPRAPRRGAFEEPSVVVTMFGFIHRLKLGSGLQSIWVKAESGLLWHFQRPLSLEGISK